MTTPAVTVITTSSRNSTSTTTHIADPGNLERFNEAIAACGSGANYRSIERRKSVFAIVEDATAADVTCSKCRKLIAA